VVIPGEEEQLAVTNYRFRRYYKYFFVLQLTEKFRALLVTLSQTTNYRLAQHF
jgi:hypothetical protein